MAESLALQSLFPLALAQVRLPLDPWEGMLLIQEVLRLRGEAEGNSNPGCAWTGDLNGIWQLHDLAPFASLSEQVRQQAWLYLLELGFDPVRVELHFQRSWPVISEPGQGVGRHHHPNAHLSAVLYLNGDGSGRSGCLRLFPPGQVNELVPGLAVGEQGPFVADSPQRQRWMAPWVEIAPRAGLLVLFPARIDHAVTANEDPEDRRISLAFDLALTAPHAGHGDPAPPEYLAPHPSQWSGLPGPST